MEKVYRERDFDFRGYKESTLTRRLGRRLRARGVQTYIDYARVLDNDPTEYDRLFMDLTINVTSFFRDVVAFKALEEVVLPALITKGETNIRIWSAGCATGEEPYSIAMFLMECLDWESGSREVSILATDIDNKALQRAREGLFTPKEVVGIRPAWLERYFYPHKDGFRVKPALKELVTFEEHNLVSDPPYCELDLVVCRNVLIYLNPMPQAQMIEGFYTALKKGGFLLLGKAEVPVDETKDLFKCLDRKARLYQKAG
jgi:chemotaxis methyl-accepting protein methylase